MSKRRWQKVDDVGDDWRLLGLRYKMSDRLSAGMPDDMKMAVRLAAKRLGISMSEVVRRLIARGL